MIRVKRSYLDDTKEILNEMGKKPVSKFFVDLNKEGVFIETRMIGGIGDCYENIRLEVPTMLCLSEILDALNNSDGMYYNFCKDGVECFTSEYDKSF